uniref:Uncharacterized protein n=1 Tax=Helianthus annuus TaxID=4232 RepID=A0A251TU90_HELAN
MITKLLNGFPDFVQTSRYIRYRLVTQRCRTTMQGSIRSPRLSKPSTLSSLDGLGLFGKGH